jgi:monovalent cation:proton antiporter-2 (CPA2) family protein
MIFAAAATIAVPIFRYFRIGAILAYLFAGIVIGPSGAGFIEHPETVLHFSELGVVFLLFIIGLELAPQKLWKMRKLIFGMGMTQMLLTGALFTLAGIGFGFDIGVATVIGFGLALSSTAFGVQLLEENRQLNTLHGQTSFGILMFQDLSVVPLLALVTYLAPGESGDGEITLGSVAKAIAIFIAIILISRYVMRHILRHIAASRIQEVFLAMSLLIVVGTGIIIESIGFSLGMGAFMAGVLLADSEYRHELESNLMPFKNLLLGLFFIAVGMSLNLSTVISQPHWVLLFTLGLITCKAILLLVPTTLFSCEKVVRYRVSSTLLQGGEFAFVLFALAEEKKLYDSELVSFLGASVTISMAATPFVFSWVQRKVSSNSNSKASFDEIVSDEAEVIVAGFGRFGQIVTRFLKAQDIRFTILEHSAEQVETARRFGNKVYYGDASRKDVLEAAGTAKAKMFVLAVDDVAKSVEIATLVRQHFPHLKVFARVRNRQHAIDLLKLGIENVHRETYLTSLEVAKEVLMEKGYARSDINGKLAEFRNRDEAILRQQMNFVDNQEEFIHFTSQANRELEQILKLEKEEVEAHTETNPETLQPEA